MTLAPGTFLGPYEVVGRLGSGGMGEVHRARDRRLGREVALKILPAELASDGEHRQRFEREARAASALQHPAIVAIHDVGVHEGTPFIAMELVEGRTLRELLAGGALGVRRALELAAPIAEGLAQAHELGIVHRDLKPENVVVSRDGFVKVLDFGLAKVDDGVLAPEAGTHTGPVLRTVTGAVMGTAGYMSPEQAAGRPADYRTDQFSLGLILYEMVAGRRAFQRETAVETLAAVLKEEPEPLERAAPRAPAPLRWIVERCLEKDPQGRYASTRDLARDLRTLREHLSEASTRALPGVGTGGPALVTRRRALALGLGSSLAAGALGIAGGLRLAHPEAPGFRRLTFRRGTVRTARFAPDGHTIVYAAAWEGEPIELFSARTDSTDFRSLGLQNADVLGISREGEMALALDRRQQLGFEMIGTLARMSLAGGAARPVVEDVLDADWAPDGRELAVVRDTGGERRLEFPPGRVLFTTGAGLSSPRVSPDGRRVAAHHHHVRGDNAGTVIVVEDGRMRKVAGPWSAINGLNWVRGELWFTAARTGNYAELYAASVDGTHVRRVVALPGRVALHDVAADGRALLDRVNWSREIRGLAPGTSQERGLSWLDWSFLSGLSADGRTLMLVEQGEGAGTDYVTYLRLLDGSPAVRLGAGRGLALSPDGAWVLTAPQPRDQGPLTLVPTGAGEPRPLSGPPLVVQAGGFLPSGQGVVYTASVGSEKPRVYVQMSGGERRPITEEGFTTNTGAPDQRGGRVVVRGPDRQLWIVHLDGSKPELLPGQQPSDLPLGWDERDSVYVASPNGLPARVDLVDVRTGARRPWGELAPPDPAGVSGLFPVLITPGGTSYAYSYRRLLGDLYVVSGLS